MKHQIIRYARAGHAGLFLCTAEETRAEAIVKTATDELRRPLHAWSATEGFIDTQLGTIQSCLDPAMALDQITDLQDDAVILLRDFGAFLEDKDPVLHRKMRDTLRNARSTAKLLILLGVWKSLPAELEREITRLDLALPDAAELDLVLDGIIASAGLTGHRDLTPVLREAALAAAGGLTTLEAENAFALSLIESETISPVIVSREKAQALKKGGLLEVITTTESLESIGGLDRLKGWLLQRREAFTKRARDYGLPLPKGMLVLGVPGTGKSLTAKATASVFGVPLLKLDAGKLFGSLVGQSEANLRSVIQTAEAISPCVLWIDEIEKGFGGAGSSGGSDGGTSSRVFGTMLNWLQDKAHPVFVVATANDVSKLPPEMLRKGRWDELWFVDLPDTRERAAIWDLVIEKFGRERTNYDTVVLARASELHTGAEIEATFVEALHRGFTEDREPTELDLGEVLSESVPLATTMSESIERLRHWANGRRSVCVSIGTRDKEVQTMSEDRDWDAETLIPKGEYEATRRLRHVQGISAGQLAGLTNEEILLPWWSFFWLHPGLHPDDAAVWPAGVSDALPLATETYRRYQAGQITDGEYYPVEAVRDRIQRARTHYSRQQLLPPQPKADTSGT